MCGTQLLTKEWITKLKVLSNNNEINCCKYFTVTECETNGYGNKWVWRWICKLKTLSHRKIERYTNRNVEDCFAYYGFSCSRVEFEDMDTNVADPEIITTNLPRKPAKIRIFICALCKQHFDSYKKRHRHYRTCLKLSKPSVDKVFTCCHCKKEFSDLPKYVWIRK